MGESPAAAAAAAAASGAGGEGPAETTAAAAAAAAAPQTGRLRGALRAGSLVFAKQGKFPWWPGMVTYDPFESEFCRLGSGGTIAGGRAVPPALLRQRAAARVGGSEPLSQLGRSQGRGP